MSVDTATWAAAVGAAGAAGAVAGAAAGDDEPGLLVLAPDDSVATANRAAERWLDELGGDRPQLPVAVSSVAERARRQARGPGGRGRGARAGVRTEGGRWVVVRGSLLGEGPAAPVAVLVEPARPRELGPLLADAYGLTERERRVTELVAGGCSTRQIADRLHLSAYTVQDHLKSIFGKSGTASRGELVARVFFDHHVPGLTPTRA
jgi:DNA-binding CsgD family transcriptional regulator